MLKILIDTLINKHLVINSMRPTKVHPILFFGKDSSGKEIRNKHFLKGVALVYAINEEYMTAEIKIIQLNTKFKLLDKDAIVKMYDHIFKNLKLRKITSRVSSEDKHIVKALRNNRWREIIAYEQYNEHDEHQFYMFDRDWKQEKKYYKRSYTDLKKFKNKLTRGDN